MLEFHILAIGGHFQNGLHVAEGGAKHQLVALGGEVAQDALGVGGLRHILDIGGNDLVAEFLFNGLAAVVMRKGPATVADRSHIGECNFERLGLGCRRYRFRLGRGLLRLTAAYQCAGGQGTHCRNFEYRTFM